MPLNFCLEGSIELASLPSSFQPLSAPDVRELLVDALLLQISSPRISQVGDELNQSYWQHQHGRAHRGQPFIMLSYPASATSSSPHPLNKLATVSCSSVFPDRGSWIPEALETRSYAEMGLCILLGPIGHQPRNLALLERRGVYWILCSVLCDEKSEMSPTLNSRRPIRQRKVARPEDRHDRVTALLVQLASEIAEVTDPIAVKSKSSVWSSFLQ